MAFTPPQWREEIAGQQWGLGGQAGGPWPTLSIVIEKLGDTYVWSIIDDGAIQADPFAHAMVAKGQAPSLAQAKDQVEYALTTRVGPVVASRHHAFDDLPFDTLHDVMVTETLRYSNCLQEWSRSIGPSSPRASDVSIPGVQNRQRRHR